MKKTKKQKIPAPAEGVVRACSGIVESVHIPPYGDYIVSASQVIGENYAADDASEIQRQKLVEAVKLNLINRKEYPYSLLQRKYNLPLDIRSFLWEKRRFIYTLATLCGFLPKEECQDF